MLWWKRMWKKLSVNYDFEKFPKTNFDIVWCSIDIVKIIWMRWQCVKLKRRNIVLKLMMSILSYFAQISAHSEVTDHRFFIRSIVRHSDFITRVRPYWRTFFELPYRHRYYVPLRNVFNMKKLQLALLFSLIGGVIWIYGKGERDPTPRVFRSTGSLCFRDCKSSFVH